MNWDQIEGNWKEFKGKVKQKWGQLSDNDLDIIKGKKEELLGALQKKYGLKKDEAEKEIIDFEKGNKIEV